MRSQKLLSCISLSLLLTTSCRTPSTIPAATHQPQPLQKEVYIPMRKPTHVSTTKKSSYIVEKYTLGNSKITMYNAHGENNSVLVIPQLKGPDILAHLLAKHYARNGMNGCVLKSDEIEESFTQSELEQWAATIHQEGCDVASWLRTYEKGKLGIVGFSLGGIVGSTIAGRVESSAHVFMLTGGDIPKIFETSEEGILRRLRKKIDLDTLTAPDPIDFAPYIDPTSVYLIIAEKDTTVPTRQSELFRKALHQPETSYLPCGHYQSMLYFPFLKKQSGKFLEEKLID